jgi:hypothetical protein
MNLTVNRLIRTGFGPFRLGKMTPGGVAELQLLPHFTAQVAEAMATGVPVRAPNVRPTASTGSRGVVKRPLSKPSTESPASASSGLARARPASPRPYTAATRSSSNSNSSSKTRVKRGRGGGIAVRPPKESAREQVAADRKRKKYNKVQAWALRHKPKSKPVARGRGPNARASSSSTGSSGSARRSNSSNSSSRRSYS